MNIHILPTDKPSKLQLQMNGNLHIENGQTIALRSYQNIYITSDEEIKEGDYWIYICPINGLDYGDNNNPIVKNNLPNSWFQKLHDRLNYKKIILTTDQDLIKDGIQAIDDDFLQWFIDNSNCREVEFEKEHDDTVPYLKMRYCKPYRIIIPKEPKQDLEKEMFELEEQLDIPSYLRWYNSKPKQETLEEAADKSLQDEIKYWYEKTGSLTSEDIVKRAYSLGITECAKLQSERMYSEEEVRKAIQLARLCTLDSNTGEFIDLSGLTEVCTYGLKETHSEDSIIEQFKKK